MSYDCKSYETQSNKINSVFPDYKHQDFKYSYLSTCLSVYLSTYLDRSINRSTLSDKRREINPTYQTGKGRNQPFQGFEKSHSTMTILEYF